jgi:hypothetical protein
MVFNAQAIQYASDEVIKNAAKPGRKMFPLGNLSKVRR